MMNKKAMPETVVKLIIGVIVLAVILIIFLYPSETLGKEQNVQAVNQWVKFRGIAQGTDKVVSPLPGVNDLGTPIEVEDVEDLVVKGNNPPKLFTQMEEDMVDCWRAFEKGEVDFLNSIEKEVFCFTCRSYLFSEDIKKQNAAIPGFNKYLNDSGALKYLNNDPSYSLDPEDLEEDVLPTNKDLYVFFFAASGRGFGNILSNLLLAEDISPEDQKKGFDPRNVIQPEAQIDELLTASEEAELSFLASGTTAVPSAALSSKTVRKYASKKLQEKFSKEVAKEGLEIAAKELSEETVEAIAKREALEKVGQLSFEFTAKKGSEATTKAVAKKTAGKVVAKTFAKAIGARAIPLIGWGITIGTAGVGVYKMVFDEKPFVAKVILVDQDGVHKICNE
ncbi:hypothetical protein J4216_06725 [Candidatus Woesearchaeota archaeon]|nr:hypothetical protein [Candidatus Woesearchaeota archaeon]